MQGNPQIIQTLNKVLTSELTAINQYFSACSHVWSLGPGAVKRIPLQAVDSRHEKTDELIERILFLEGLPNLQHLGKLRIGENPRNVWRVA